MNENIKDIAVRFSEYEPINYCQKFKNIFNWVWIDTPNILPINKNNNDKLSSFKKCLVCPERWNRVDQIVTYKNFLKENNIEIDAVMTSLKTSKYWI